MQRPCEYEKCLNYATHVIAFRCYGCPTAETRHHEEVVCNKHLAIIVQKKAACSFCRTSVIPGEYHAIPPLERMAGYPGTVEQRLTDYDRDKAVEALGEAFAVGQLTKEEFDQRAEEVSQAVYPRDVVRVLADIKPPTPPFNPDSRLWMKAEKTGGLATPQAVALIAALVAFVVIAGLVAVLI